MNIIFAGTPDFAAAALEALLAAGHHVMLALTQPDRPAGRGLKSSPTPVKRMALEHHIPVEQPVSLRHPGWAERIGALNPEAMVVAAYGLILPPALLKIPARGCINIHASLLPRWRGAAPIQRAILAGDAKSGISIMQMDEGLDTGPILVQEAVPIAATETSQSLHDKLAQLGARLIVQTLADSPTPRPQPSTGVTYAAKIEKSEATLDWRDSAAQLERKIRAFCPAPGASTSLTGLPIKIWAATVLPGERAQPGTIAAADAHGIVVACGENALRITELQRAGGKRLSAAAFLSGMPLRPGTRFGD